MSGRSPVRAVVRLRARASWSWSGSSCHSVPQCSDTTTTSAPAFRAARASSTMRASSIRPTAQGWSAGSG
ncbi:hypothetical protein SVIOM342S_05138 [Streptomyces violaceorubidus]